MKFFVVMFIVDMTVGTIAATVVGLFMGKSVNSFYGITSTLIVGFIEGVFAYNLAPSKKLPASLVYYIITTSFSFYTHVITTGRPFFLNPNELIEFYPMVEIANFIGPLLGIWSAYQAEKNELDANSSIDVEK